MTWDSYDPPEPFRNAPRERLHQEPPADPAKARAVAGVLVGMVLLALAFTIAANAQETTTGDGAGDTGQQAQEEQAQEEQAQEEPGQEEPGQERQQSGATTSMQQQEPEAQAAEEEATARPLDGQIVEQAEGTYAASELIGQSVISAEGEDMGKISDLLVTEDNRIAGAVIGVGGFLGFGEKPIAIEIDRLERSATEGGGEQWVLDVSREQLEQAPQFVSLDEQRQRLEAEQARQQQGTGTQDPAAEGQSLTQ